MPWRELIERGKREKLIKQLYPLWIMLFVRGSVRIPVGILATVGDWMEYTVNIPVAGSQQIYFRVAGPGGTVRIQQPDGTVLGTATLPRTTSGQIYATGSTTINLPAGEQTLRLYAVTAGWNFNWREVATEDPPGTLPATNPPDNAAENNLTLVSTFEDEADFAKWEQEICRPGALQISSEVPARKGKYSARFEFTKADGLTYNFIRAEIRQKSFPEDEKWR